MKLEQTQEDIREKAVKAFREVGQTQEAAQLAREMVELRKEAEKEATAAVVAKKAAAVTTLLLATKARMLAEVEAIKADLAHRQSFSILMSLVGK